MKNLMRRFISTSKCFNNFTDIDRKIEAKQLKYLQSKMKICVTNIYILK